MTNIESPMAAKIFQILVTVGQTIEEDDEVVILDALKMENPVYAPEGGVVKEIKVIIGQQVEEGDVIVVLE